MTNIFREPGGQPIKFFIQKSLPNEVIAHLERNIIDNGGQVQTKVPNQGYLLIDPGSPEAIRLSSCWRTLKHPQRYFVPYTFVQECLTVGKLLPQVFIKEDGSSRKFYIHTSVNDEDIRRNLGNQIGHLGGKVMKTKGKAEIIIADERWEGFEPLCIYYDDTKAGLVEGIPWVKKCIASGALQFTPVKRKNVGGRITGSKRTEFTSKDDNNLARYIAAKLPNPTMRGRTGNKVYKDLCSNLELYPWAVRHPWQSWRERYRNNVDRFNNLIATYVEFGPNPNEPNLDSDISNSEREDDDAKSIEKTTSKEVEDALVTKPPDDWDASQWPIKIGTKEPPPWGHPKKRSLEMQQMSEGPSKRAKIMDANDNDSPHVLKSNSSDIRDPETNEQTQTLDDKPQNTRPPDPEETISASDIDKEILGEETQEFLEANRRLVGQAATAEEDLLMSIATRYRFLLEEVNEEFQELGQDLRATELHFKDIRDYISQKKLTRRERNISK